MLCEYPGEAWETKDETFWVYKPFVCARGASFRMLSITPESKLQIWYVCGSCASHYPRDQWEKVKL